MEIKHLSYTQAKGEYKMNTKRKATEVKKNETLKESSEEAKKTVADATKYIEKNADSVKVGSAENAVKRAAIPRKKVTEKRPIEKKAAVKSALTLQIDGQDYDPEKILADAVKAAKEIKKDVQDVKIYVNVNDKAAYFTVDGEGKSEYRINL